MRAMSQATVQALRERFPVGTEVELIRMEDDFAPPAGTHGKVIGVDDIGTLHVAWSTGSSLGLVPDIDTWKVVSKDD